MPKKPPTTYMLYFKQVYEKYKKKNPNDNVVSIAIYIFKLSFITNNDDNCNNEQMIIMISLSEQITTNIINLLPSCLPMCYLFLLS